MRAIIDFRARVFASFSKCNQHMDLAVISRDRGDLWAWQ